MFKTIVLFQAFLLGTAMKIPPGLQYRFGPELQELSSVEQNLPCTLYEKVVEFEDGRDASEWMCEVIGADAKNAAGGTSRSQLETVSIVGMEHVLKAKPDIESGRTTLFAKGAGVSNYKLFVASNNVLTFGEKTNQDDIRQRKLSSTIEDLSILVVRVSTPDKSMTKNIAEISGDVFGTAGSGDTINLKSLVEGCSNNVVTINPGSGTGYTCVDDPDAIFDVPRNDPGLIYDCDFFNNYRFTTPGDLCPAYGDSPQIDDPNETANTRCCICGGGDPGVAYDNNVVNGVMNLQLTINTSGSSSNQLETAAVTQLQNLFYANNLANKFDHVMLCFPKGSYTNGDTSFTDWVAYAYVGGYLSVYNGGKWCANEVTQLHELGHNFGLKHSSEGSVEYGDMSGAMGFTTGAADDASYGNRMCYNGAHSWQLGWYTPYNLEINPLTTNFAGTLVGVDRVPSLLAGENLVLKLSNSQQDYYIMYNHAVGVNAGSTEARNQVTITTKTTASNALTNLVSKLSQGSHVTFTNWAGTTDSVTVLVTSITTATSTGNAGVEVWKGAIGDRPVPTTPSPTPGPTPPPTPGPTPAPTPSPTPGPTQPPTPGPTPPPTPGPTPAPTPPPTPGPTPAPTPPPTPGPTPPPTPGPTPPPTPGPTPAPTLPPTPGPTPPPTPGPTPAPTPPPTPGPTPAPTLPPTPGPTPPPTPGPTPAPTPPPTPGPTLPPTPGPTPAPTPPPTAAPTPPPTPGPTPPPTPGPTPPPTPTPATCVAFGGSCSSDSDCCSNKCRGGVNNRSCKNGRRLGAPSFMN